MFSIFLVCSLFVNCSPAVGELDIASLQRKLEQVVTDREMSTVSESESINHSMLLDPLFPVPVQSEALKRIQALFYDEKFRGSAIYDRNHAILSAVVPMKLVYRTNADYMVWEMSRLAENEVDNGYIATTDSGNAVWMTLAAHTGRNVGRDTALRDAYIEKYQLNQLDLNAISSWTESIRFVVNDHLEVALAKLPAFQGIVVRNTNLDEASVQALFYGLVHNVPVPMQSFVKNTATHKVHPGVLESVMSTSPAGKQLYNGDLYSARLLIHSANGRLVAPLSTFQESEILFHSKLSPLGFKVVGRGESVNPHNTKIDVWLLEELA